MTESDGIAAIPLRVARRRGAVEEWALVLAAEGLRPRIDGTPEGFALSVPPAEVERAEAALGAWERENRAPPRRRPVPEVPLDREAGSHALAVAAALIAFFAWTGPDRGASRWFERGSGDAARVLGGEPWRVVTALTLHADWPHVVGNAVAGALFFAGVFRAFGLGVGALLVLVAGAGGNALNAWLQGGEHVSIGASTAVFGALGVLAGRGLARGRARGLRAREAFVPVAAALALLAMLGTEGARVDLWAHLWGLAVGAGLGALAAYAARPLAGPRIQRAAGVLALAIVLGAWALALRTGG